MQEGCKGKNPGKHARDTPIKWQSNQVLQTNQKKIQQPKREQICPCRCNKPRALSLLQQIFMCKGSNFSYAIFLPSTTEQKKETNKTPDSRFIAFSTALWRGKLAKKNFIHRLQIKSRISFEGELTNKSEETIESVDLWRKLEPFLGSPHVSSWSSFPYFSARNSLDSRLSLPPALPKLSSLSLGFSIALFLPKLPLFSPFFSFPLPAQNL